MIDAPEAAPQRRRLAFVQKALQAFDREILRPGSRLRQTIDRVPVQPGDRTRERDLRIERIAAVRLVFLDLMEWLDPVTLTVGRGPDGRVCGRRIDKLAERQQIGQRRAERAVRDLHAAGWLISHRRAEKQQDGTWQGKTSVRCLAAEVFQLLGLAAFLHKTRKRLSDARKNLHALSDYARQSLALRGRKWREQRERAGEPQSLADLLGMNRPPTRAV